MDTSTAFLLALTLMLAGMVARQKPERLPDVFKQIRKQGGDLLLRVPLGLFTASLLSHLLPASAIGPLIGGTSGWRGVLLACALGAVVPGGPMVSFPLALVIWQMGAGELQMVGFLASWSIYAIHRVISYELPMMGGRFVLIRLSSVWMLPPVAALIAAALLPLLY